MFKFCCFNIRRIVKTILTKKFSTKGIQFNTANVQIFSLGSIGLNKIIIQKHNSILTINTLIIDYSIWRSLFNFKLIGELTFENISIESPIFSNTPFKVDKVILPFTLNSKEKLFLVKLNQIPPITFQLIKLRQCFRVVIEVENLGWNHFINLFRKHFQSNLLRSSCSDDCISLYADMTFYRKENKLPMIKTKIECDTFHLFTTNDLSLIQIDKDYLFNLFVAKVSCKHYIYYNQIPAHLINTIICTEDPLFWKHSGISSYFIGYAISENIKKQKLARGASTITMQLVRNLFLSHDKTFTRKIEESIITLLLENQYNIEKKDILELYFNLIQFAPNVYGIYEAALHYFNKEPAELTLTEILVLTYIVPRPLFFEEALHLKSKKLEKNLYHHIKSLSDTLYSNHSIDLKTYISIKYHIHFAPSIGNLNLDTVRKMNVKLDDFSRTNLQGVHPDLYYLVSKSIIETPISFVVTCGVRSIEQQRTISSIYRINKGEINSISTHQIQDDGYKHAVDVYPLINGQIIYSGVEELKVIAKHILIVAHRLNIEIIWGGNWTKMKDYAHFELL